MCLSIFCLFLFFNTKKILYMIRKLITKILFGTPNKGIPINNKMTFKTIYPLGMSEEEYKVKWANIKREPIKFYL